MVMVMMLGPLTIIMIVESMLVLLRNCDDVDVDDDEMEKGEDDSRK
jgi:hypothetical protein